MQSKATVSLIDLSSMHESIQCSKFNKNNLLAGVVYNFNIITLLSQCVS